MHSSSSDHSLEGDEIDLDELVTVPADEDSFNAESYVSQDANLTYNEASMSSISESETGNSNSATSTGKNAEEDITSRLDALERVMAEDMLSPTSTEGSVATPKGNIDGVETTDATISSIAMANTTETKETQETQEIAVATRETVNNDATTVAAATTTTTTTTTAINADTNQQEFDAHMARLEQALADSPASKTSGMNDPISSLSFSALAESQRARGGDDDLANRLHRLEQLLGDRSPAQPTSSSSAATPVTQNNTMSMSMSSMATPNRYNTGGPADDAEDVVAHLARLDRLLGSSVTPASRMTTGTARSRFTGGTSPATNTGLSASSVDQQRVAGAEVENQMLRDRIVDLEHQLSSRGDVIENMMNSSRLSNGRNSTYNNNNNNEQGVYSELERLKRNEQAAKRALVTSEAALDEMRTKLSHMKEKQRGVDAKTKVELDSIEQQLSHSEHRVRARETVIATLQDRLQAEVRRSQQTRERDRSTFKRVQGREVRNGSKTDQKTTEIITMYENQRKEMDLEVQQLRRDVRRLSMDLKDRENEGSPGSTRFTNRAKEDEEAARMASRLETETREVEDRAALLERKEKQVLRDITRMKEEVNNTNKIMQQLEEVNLNLKMELESRPTMRDWKRSQKMIELLQNKLRDTIDGNENMSSSERAQNEREGLQSVAGQDTSAMVKKDRENHRLKLHLLDNMARNTAIELLKDICRTFGINGHGILFQLLPTVERIQQVVLAVPRMQGFVRDMCYTLRVDPATTLGVAMEMGIETIKEWEIQLRRKKELDRLRTALIMEIVTNRTTTTGIGGNSGSAVITPGGTAVSDFDDVRVLAEIKGLLSNVKDLQKEEEFYDSIAEEMKMNPNEMTTRMVNHFQQLFDVNSTRGIMPKMNELFLYTSEMNTFMNAVRARLALNQHATTSAVMNALSQITSTPEGSEELKHGNKEGGEKKEDGGGDMSNLMEEKRTKGGTAFSVTRKGVPGWKVAKN